VADRAKAKAERRGRLALAVPGDDVDQSELEE
jgi:hypothetical protein